MTTKTTVEISTVGSGNLFSIQSKVGRQVVCSGYATKYKVVVEDNFIMVFTYNNSENHNFYFAADEVIIDGEKTYPEKSLKSSYPPAKGWLNPNSSNILKYRYDDENGTLAIVFHSSPDVVYTYMDVPRGIYIEMYNAKSKGSYYSNNVRGKYSVDTDY